MAIREVIEELFYSDATTFLDKCKFEEASPADLLPLPDDLAMPRVAGRVHGFSSAWIESEHSPNQASTKFLHSLFCNFRSEALRVGMFSLLRTALGVSIPLVLHAVLSLSTRADVPWFSWIAAAVTLFAVVIAYNLAFERYMLENIVLFQKISGGLQLFGLKLLEKRTVISKPRDDTEVGRYSNLILADSSQLAWLAQRIPDLSHHILVILASSFLLFHYIGWLGLAVGIFLGGVGIAAGRLGSNFRKSDHQARQFRDRRVELIHQMIEGIRVLKALGWTKAFSDKIQTLRDHEVREKKSQLVMTSSYTFLIWATTKLSIFAAFGLLMSLNYSIQLSTILVALVIFDMIEESAKSLPANWSSFYSGMVSADRWVHFIRSHGNEHIAESAPYKSVIPQELLPQLKGKLTAIVGSIGSGKSTFLEKMHSELKCSSNLDDSCIRFLPQKPIIFQDSVQNNILAGSDSLYLEEALFAAALDQDIQRGLLRLSDEVAEGGVGLSGGQRQRVALSRLAVGKPAEYYLLDDPFSSLDFQTMKTVFHRLLCGHLKETTRLVSLSSLDYLNNFEFVIFVDKGRIEAYGNPVELRKHSPKFKYFCQSSSLQQPATIQYELDARIQEVSPKSLVVREDMERGKIAPSTYLSFISSFDRKGRSSGARMWFVLLCALSIGASFLPALQNVWLMEWAGHGGPPGSLVNLTVYVALGLLSLTFALGNRIAWKLFGLVASTSLHRKALDGVLNAPLRFFVENPAGRIVNRFSGDVETLDNDVAPLCEEIAILVAQVITTLILFTFFAPQIIPVVGLMFWSYSRLQKKYLDAARFVKRLNACTTSAKTSQLKELLTGRETLRGCNGWEWAAKRFIDALDDDQRALYTRVYLNRWFSTRVPITGAVLCLCVALALPFSRQSGFLALGLTGMALVYSLRMSDLLNQLVRVFSRLENSGVSIERIKAYSDLLPAENGGADLCMNHEGPVLSARQLDIRYGPQPVLENVNFTVHPGEKVLIMGATGSGKSSIFSVLLREHPPAGGEIKLFGRRLEETSSNSIQKTLSICRQEPWLFSGSVRENLDLMSVRGDHAIKSVLQDLGIGREEDPQGSTLDTLLAKEVSHLSAGERQIVCLARTVLVGSPVLLLDEPTSMMDKASALNLKEFLSTKASDKTVLLISHRNELTSICDKVFHVVGRRLNLIKNSSILEEMSCGADFSGPPVVANIPREHPHSH